MKCCLVFVFVQSDLENKILKSYLINNQKEICKLLSFNNVVK